MAAAESFLCLSKWSQVFVIVKVKLSFVIPGCLPIVSVLECWTNMTLILVLHIYIWHFYDLSLAYHTILSPLFQIVLSVSSQHKILESTSQAVDQLVATWVCEWGNEFKSPVYKKKRTINNDNFINLEKKLGIMGWVLQIGNRGPLLSLYYHLCPKNAKTQMAYKTHTLIWVFA